MKVKIDYDEWFPFYFLQEEDSGKEFDVTKEQFTRWRRVFAEFSEVQRELESIHGKWNE